MPALCRPTLRSPRTAAVPQAFLDGQDSFLGCLQTMREEGGELHPVPTPPHRARPQPCPGPPAALPPTGLSLPLRPGHRPGVQVCPGRRRPAPGSCRHVGSGWQALGDGLSDEPTAIGRERLLPGPVGPREHLRLAERLRPSLREPRGPWRSTQDPGQGRLWLAVCAWACCRPLCWPSATAARPRTLCAAGTGRVFAQGTPRVPARHPGASAGQTRAHCVPRRPCLEAMGHKAPAGSPTPHCSAPTSRPAPCLLSAVPALPSFHLRPPHCLCTALPGLRPLACPPSFPRCPRP